MSTKTAFLLSTMVTLLLYSACSSISQGTSIDAPETPPEQMEEPIETDQQTYSVYFNTNGGSWVSWQAIISGDTVVRPDNPTRENFIFGNWFRDKALTSIYTFSTPVTSTSNLILYAQWIPEGTQTYEVTFSTGGGNSMQHQTIIEGEMANKPEDPIREDYEFLNWYSNPDAPEDAYDFDTEVRANITIYANWVEINRFYKVTFNTGGGDLIREQMIISGDTVVRPNNPRRRIDFIFENWYTDEDFTNVYNFSTPVTSDLTLYAKGFDKDYDPNIDPSTITGIVVTPKTSTTGGQVEINGNYNLQELYNYLKYYLFQPANVDVEPFFSINGNIFEFTDYTIIIPSSSSLTKWIKTYDNNGNEIFDSDGNNVLKESNFNFLKTNNSIAITVNFLNGQLPEIFDKIDFHIDGSTSSSAHFTDLTRGAYLYLYNSVRNTLYIEEFATNRTELWVPVRKSDVLELRHESARKEEFTRTFTPNELLNAEISLRTGFVGE